MGNGSNMEGLKTNKKQLGAGLPPPDQRVGFNVRLLPTNVPAGRLYTGNHPPRWWPGGPGADRGNKCGCRWCEGSACGRASRIAARGAWRGTRWSVVRGPSYMPHATCQTTYDYMCRVRASRESRVLPMRVLYNELNFEVRSPFVLLIHGALGG